MERQIKSRLNEPLKPDPRPRVGRSRQEALFKRRQSNPETSVISPPTNFKRARSGTIFAALWQCDKSYSIGTVSFDGTALTLNFNDDPKGRQVRSLLESGQLAFDAAVEAGSILARLKS